MLLPSAVMIWVALVIALAVTVGLVRGGTVSHLAEAELRAWPLFFLGVGLQLGAIYLPDDRSWSNDVGVGLLLASFVVLLTGIFFNRTRPGMWVAALGIAMNFLVIAANGGMPVSPEAAVLAGAESTDLVLDAKHVVLESDSAFAFLADVIPVRPLRQVISLGDVFLGLGIGIFIEAQLRRPTRLFRHESSSAPGSAAPR